MSDDLLTIYEGLDPRLVLKTTKSGKQRFSIRIEAEPVIFNVNPKQLGAPIAQAIAHHLRERVRGISAAASQATIEYRKKAEKAMRAGKSWATKKYAGGKMGAREPNQSDRLFNDSGRFAESIAVGAASDDSWRVNVAANRLDPQTASAAGVVRIWSRLVDLVPEFGDAAKLMASSDIVRSMVRAREAMITKGRATTGKASAWDVAKAAGKLIKTAADILAA